jgi:hypothetical protein
MTRVLSWIVSSRSGPDFLIPGVSSWDDAPFRISYVELLEPQYRALGRTEPLKILTPLKSISNARDQELSLRVPDPREPCEWRYCAMRHPTHVT